MNMIMTVLKAHVEHEKWATLEEAYKSGTTRIPPQMSQTFLVQSAANPTLWRGISVWKSREALEEYRRSVETPGGVLMFRAAGAEPALSLFEVAAARS
jgi:quinol monooxygenase YgiN